MRAAVVMVCVVCAAPAWADGGDAKEVAEKLKKAVQESMQNFQAVAKSVSQEMEAAKTQTPTKAQDAKVLAAWEAAYKSMSEYVSYAGGHQGELGLTEDTLHGMSTSLKGMRNQIEDAREHGAVKTLNEMGEQMKKRANAKNGKVALSAKSNWTPMHHAVKTGDMVHIEATGKWSVSPKYGDNDADGSDRTGGLLDYRVYKGAKIGALLCKVGKSDKIYAGKSIKLMADQDGDVNCTINDTDRGNNGGELEVNFVSDK